MCVNTGSISAFIEITFGINILTGLYQRFRDVLTVKLAQTCKAHIAAFKVTEVTTQDEKRRLYVLLSHLKDIDSKYEILQKKICKIIQYISIVFAIACIVVLYLGLIGWWNVVLILPYPLYLGISLLIFRYFSKKAKKRIKKHTDYIALYECQTAIDQSDSIAKELEKIAKFLPDHNHK
jgi:ABC-type bacteriocin/lantibiotic exporter with double-glycine peptidase domain